MNDQEPPKIEFPCDYPIKVLGIQSEGFKDLVLEVMRRHAGDIQRSTVEAFRLRRDLDDLAHEHTRTMDEAGVELSTIDHLLDLHDRLVCRPGHSWVNRALGVLELQIAKRIRSPGGNERVIGRKRRLQQIRTAVEVPVLLAFG